MFCPKCGNQVPDGSTFCPRCGNPLRPVAQPAARPVQGQQATPPMPGQPVVQPATRSRGKAKVIIPIVAAVVVVVAVVIIGLATSWFGLAGTRVKPSVNDYTWGELSAISKEISASGSEDAALQVAEKYNLCTPDGKLDGTQVKSVTLSDGTQTEVQIAGFYHDDKSDGSGKAGITFIFKDAVAEHEMNQSDTNSGGWQNSEMRSWLSSDFMSMLSSDLAKDIVTVDKLTNNAGETTDVSSVTATHDAVWLFSPTELYGSINWESGNNSYVNDVLNAEGTEYQLFSDSGVSSNSGNTILTKNYLPASSASDSWTQGEACNWWVRSAIPSSPNGFNGINSGGDPHGYGGAANASGVVPGFCI